MTVCDTEGIILEMNDAAADQFKKDGGNDLIGTNLLDCHPEPSRTKLRVMLGNQTTNVYTISKKGKKKLIYHTPWYDEGKYAGFVEISFDIPFDLPHFKRA